MKEIYLTERKGLTPAEMEQGVKEMLAQFPDMKKVLIVPPDYTRCHSYAGELTKVMYRLLEGTGVHTDIMPALGTHTPMTREELDKFFGPGIHEDRILIHHWQTDTVKLGTVPKETVGEISGGLYEEEIEVELDYRLMDGTYDRIFSVGQVVPHEIAGMANYSKNLFVGLGGRSMINKSHILAVFCGTEKGLGVMNSPVRKLYDYAQQNYLDGKLPVVFMQTVTKETEKGVILQGLYIGESRKPFEMACSLSQEQNIIYLEHRAKKLVTYLDPEELKSTWVGNKGIYRTRMAVADGGELIVLAPGITSFGENPEMDAMTRKFGYRGTEYIMEQYRQGAFEGRYMSAAHLIQGSSDGRFKITYATCPENMSKEEIESVGYEWADYREMAEHYDPEKLRDGWNTDENGEEFYYVSTPAIGLWRTRD